MKSNPIEICILSAGMGSRLKSSKPKALQQLAGKPLLAHILNTVEKLQPDNIHVIIGQQAEMVKTAFSHASHVNWVMQTERLGTGHAVMQAAPALMPDATVVILLGDAPLISEQTLAALINLDCDLGVLSVEVKDPFNYGRIVRDDTGRVLAIVEERDANNQQRQITEINTGAMVASASLLKQWLDKLDCNNDQQEYLLTDIVAIAVAQGCSVAAHKVTEEMEVTGINTFAQLSNLERQYQQKQAATLMEQGVQIIDPSRFDLRGEVTAGKDVTIDINVILEGNVVLGDGVSIGANCVIKDSTIAAGSQIKPFSSLDQSVVGEGCSVGPYARLRPGAHLLNNVAVGNFVEVKKSTLGEGTKASHLSYLGDSTIGSGVNIGAGTITCNYDGVNKFETQIGNDVFIGSNSALVAPVEIGEGATVGAGSTITKDVTAQTLAIGRGRQVGIDKWKKPTKKVGNKDTNQDGKQ